MFGRVNMRIYLTFVHYCAIIDNVRNTQKRERYGVDNENFCNRTDF